jgi:ligand-binding SRPBCC domain-containing protein
MKSKTFELRSVMPTSVERLIAFHLDPQALKRLTPPPIFVQLLEDERKTLTDGSVTFNLWLGPIPVRWEAAHQPGPIETSFIDVMVRGPLASWRHEHLFTPHAEGAALIDRVTFTHKRGLAGALTRLIFDGPALKLFFLYRHWRTRRSVSHHPTGKPDPGNLGADQEVR